MKCDKCGLEMYRDSNFLSKRKRDVITYKCNCGNKQLKSTLLEICSCCGNRKFDVELINTGFAQQRMCSDCANTIE